MPLLFAGLLSCTNAEQAVEEANGPEAISRTIYTEKTELFVEFDPLVVGDTAHFLAHLTVLGEQFHALDSAEVSVRLHVGDKGVRSIAIPASGVGIYRISLSPVIAGEGELIFEVEGAQLKDRIKISSVRVHPDKESAMAASTAIHEAHGEVSYLKEQAWKVEFANEPVCKLPFSQVIPAGGELLPAPGAEKVIAAGADGIVSFEKYAGIPGAEVRKGQVLLNLSGSGLTDANVDRKYREARANLDKAKTDLERAETLARDRIISQKELREKQNAYELSEASFLAISRNYSGEGIRVTAPSDGIVQEVMVKDGQYVREGDALLRIAGENRVQLRAGVPQQSYSLLASVRSANFRSADGRVYSTEDLNGELLAYGRSTDEKSSMIPVSFAIDKPEGLPTGAYVEVFLKTATADSLISIPLSALMEEQGKFYVYVQLSGESFTKREIITGGRDGNRVEVISGLSEGERVVTIGAYSIKLAQASGSMPAHGHEH